MTDKGMISYKRKPLISFEGRLIVANELKSVSFVLPIDGINFVSIASKYKFEFFLHGDDWKDNVQSNARKDLIREMDKWGGVVIDIPYTMGVSSTSILDAIEYLYLSLKTRTKPTKFIHFIPLIRHYLNLIGNKY